MKTFFLALSMGMSFAANAQTSGGTLVTTAAGKSSADISVPGLYCEACMPIVEQALFKQDGILKYKVDWKKKIVKVTWVNDRTNIENIKTMIANSGFDAGDVTADETSKKRLPPCCKVPPVPKVKS